MPLQLPRETPLQLPQGKLLRERRDLASLQINFTVDLADTPLCKQRKHAPARLGFQVKHGEDHEGLTVENVIENGNFDTPVVQYNQARKAHRQHIHLVRPGDRLIRLNEETSAVKMLKEIERNTTATDTSPMSFTVERELDDLYEVRKDSSPRPVPKRSSSAFIHKRRKPAKSALSLPGSPSSCSSCDLHAQAWRRFSSNWPSHKFPEREAVPMGNVSTLAWQKREQNKA